MRIVSLFLFTMLPIMEAGTIFNVSGTNTTYGAAQAVTLSPDLVIYQAAPNYTYSTAQPVSPQYYSEQGFGSISTGNPSEYFSVAVTQGQNLDFQVSSTTPASQPTKLQLYDPYGNLLAVASGNGGDGYSSSIDASVAVSGNWVVQVTSPNPNNFGYDLQFTSPLNYTTDVLGALTNLSDPGYYSVSANVGDQLSFAVVSTSPLLSPTELLLYDPNGNLVALSAENAADGFGSIIDFTVPAGDAGNWVVEVSSAAAEIYSYDLTIQGATGLGTVNPLLTTPEPAPGPLLGAALAGLLLLGRKLSRR